MAVERTRGSGELEAAILAVLWSQGRSMTCSEILELVAGRRPAPTTLLTALERLGRKGMVRRVGDAARNVRFEPTVTQAEHASRIMLEALPDAAGRGAALLQFARGLGLDDLRILEQAIVEHGVTERGGQPSA